jgi:carbonic anhydrase/acetyltransferase-like protein (isoleucine patch superfamily)
MDVRAVILVGGARSEDSEQLAGIPIGLLDVLGEPILQRVINRLDHFGVSGIAVVSQVPASAASLARGSISPGIRWTDAVDGNFWRSAEAAFNDMAQAGAELVMVVRLGAYAELDYEDVVQFHLDKHARLTSVCDSSGAPIDTFVISASRRNDAAYLFRHELQQMRGTAEIYPFSGYINPLQDARDLRVLALDGFAGIAKVPPCGREIKPGVWVAEGAHVHRSARLLAPCFVGARAKVRAASLLTRGSVAEHHAQIDCGSIIENSTVLPSTIVGAGLDAVQSVIGFRRVWNLHRSVEVEISDRQFVGALRSAPVRMVGSAAQMAALFTKSIGQTLLGRKAAPQPELHEAVRRPAEALKNAEVAQDGLPASEFLSARRYGNE